MSEFTGDVPSIEMAHVPFSDKVRRITALALVGVALAPAGVAHAGRVDGISDQRIEQWTPDEASAAAQLHPKYARRVVSWDVMNRPEELSKVNAWLHTTTSMGLKQLVSFGWPAPHSTHNVPSVRGYRTAVTSFVDSHPAVREFTAFNEANNYPNQISPHRAARFLKELRTLCHQRCTVPAADFNQIPGLTTYLPAYRKELRKLGISPRLWAFHPFEGPMKIPTIRKLLPPKPKLWLTESALFVGPQQAKDARRLLRIKAERTYVYQMLSRDNPRQADWDAGLIDANGVPTHAFHVLRVAAVKK